MPSIDDGLKFTWDYGVFRSTAALPTAVMVVGNFGDDFYLDDELRYDMACHISRLPRKGPNLLILDQLEVAW